MDFFHRLYKLRRQAGLSQEELANLVGVTRQAVQKWEAGASRPDMDNLAALANYFNVSLDYLVTGKEPAPPPQPASAIVNNYYHPWYEYKSKRTLFGLPLVHINMGIGPRVAKGIIAIGDIAIGVVSLGGLALGLISFGGLALGLLLCLGGIAIGGIAFGGLVVGVLAIGGLAVGWFAWGGVAFGVYTVGGLSIGTKIAIGGSASAPIAIGGSAEGAQSWVIPEQGGLTADQVTIVCAAIEANAPQWVAHILEFFVRFA